MTENKMADVPVEGEITFTPDMENDDSKTSPTGTNDGEDTQATDGDQDENNQPKEDGSTDPDKDTPFHQHPRWKERETEWETRFNDQEKRHQDDLKAIREEFADKRAENKENTEIPSWFGGDQAQWNEYLQHEDAKISAAEERAIKRAEEGRQKESKAVEEATAYMQSEIKEIEGNSTLNPDGTKVDPNKLLKIVMDNDLVDSKGRWNYRAGWAMMKNTSTNAKPDTDARKKIAGATTSENKGESKPANYKTADDFKMDRPW